jgi:hypothetical protein
VLARNGAIISIHFAAVAGVREVQTNHDSAAIICAAIPRPYVFLSKDRYCEHLRQKRINGPSQEKAALVAAQTALAQARTEEAKRRSLGKEFILVSDARNFALKAFKISNYREQSLAFPHRMADRCAGLERGPMALILQEEIYAMLNAFADGTDRSVNAALDYEDDPL